MSLFTTNVTLQSINNLLKGNMGEHLGMEFTEVGDDYLIAKMPVDKRTVQPMGLLHGGASLALAETMGSVAAYCCVNTDLQYCVGLEINANHVKAVKEGFVFGTTRPLHVGKKTQVWEIKITNEKKELICVSRITMAVIDKR